MHYNGIFKTMYTFYQDFMTTKCSLVCSSKYYSFHLERWHAKVKKPSGKRVWLSTGQGKDTIRICCLIQPYAPGQASKHGLTSPPTCLLLNLMGLQVKMPDSNPSPQVSLARLLYPHRVHCPQLQNGDKFYQLGSFWGHNQLLHVYRSRPKCHLQSEAFSDYPIFQFNCHHSPIIGMANPSYQAPFFIVLITCSQILWFTYVLCVQSAIPCQSIRSIPQRWDLCLFCSLTYAQFLKLPGTQ